MLVTNLLAILLLFIPYSYIYFVYTVHWLPPQVYSGRVGGGLPRNAAADYSLLLYILSLYRPLVPPGMLRFYHIPTCTSFIPCASPPPRYVTIIFNYHIYLAYTVHWLLPPRYITIIFYYYILSLYRKLIAPPRYITITFYSYHIYPIPYTGCPPQVYYGRVGGGLACNAAADYILLLYILSLYRALVPLHRYITIISYSYIYAVYTVHWLPPPGILRLYSIPIYAAYNSTLIAPLRYITIIFYSYILSLYHTLASPPRYIRDVLVAVLLAILLLCKSYSYIYT